MNVPKQNEVPANTQRNPPCCPDPDWCRCNGACTWNCKQSKRDDD